MNRQIFPRRRPVAYTAIRPEIRSGDLLLCSGTGWFSKMIQGATREKLKRCTERSDISKTASLLKS